MYKTVILEKQEHIARLTLNRPEKLNAYEFIGQGGLMDDFHAALDEVEEDDDIKVLIIKGAGKGFSTGHDLQKVGFIYGMGTGGKDDKKPGQRIRLKVDRKNFDESYKRVFLFPKITLAQVHGYCIAGGLWIANCCDLTIASEDAILGYPEQRLAAAGSTYLPLLYITIGLKRAMGLLLTGDLISGKEAAEIGLVNKAVPPESLEEEVKKWAKKLSLLSKDGIALGKAARHLAYESMGLLAGFTQTYIFHSFGTNIKWEPEEYSFFKERRDRGVKDAFLGRDKRFTDVE